MDSKDVFEDFDEDEMLSLARKSIALECETLQSVSDRLDESFTRGLRLIGQSSGRTIVTGIGKSALIGKKIVATFNSTGTPSIFMNAVDAIHGDLGILQTGDVVICLSKSGETEELKNLIPIIKDLGNPLIAIVANTKSYLAQKADISIVTPISQEADPNDLAPTASAMAQLAVGDSLAACLIAWKGFLPKDFALLHPGGSLGKKLNLKIESLCSRHDIPLVLPNASINEVIMEISSKRLGATAVINASGKLTGIITDGDLRRMLQSNDDFSALIAHDIMTKDPKTIQVEALAVMALQMMEDYNITQLLAMDQEDYRGVIHIHDLLKEGLA